MGALGLAPAGIVQAESAPEEHAYFDDLPTVVTVTRLPQNSLELPASLTVIDRQMIEASGALYVPDLLRLVAGFQVAHVSGSRFSVTYHGMSDEYSRRIQVLVDGRSIYMPATGGVDWADVPLSIEDIDRIEVLRGPNGVAFGADSFMGVVNIITHHAAAVAGTYAKVSAGDGGYQKYLFRHGGGAGDLAYRLTMEHQGDDGFDDVVINHKLYSQKDDKHSNKLNLRLDYRAGVNDYLTFAAGINSGTRGQGYHASGSLLDVQSQPAFDTHNWRHFQQFKWQRIYSSDEDVQFHVYHNYTDTRASYQTALLSEMFGVAPGVIDGIFTPYTDQPLRVQQSTLAERYDVEFEHRFRPVDALRVVWGGEARFDQVVAPGYLGRNEPVENRLYRVFAHGEWMPEQQYRINAGAMVEHNDITGTQVSPRLAVNRILVPGHAMRLSVTEAYRSPVMLEEYADYALRYSSDDTVFDQSWKSAGGLKPEHITSYELGFMGEVNHSRIQYDFKLFREQLRNIISVVLDKNFTERYTALSGLYSGFNQATVFENLDYADIHGFEFQIKLRPDDATLLSIGFSQAYAEGVVTRDINPTRTDSINAYVPSYAFSFLLDRDFGAGWRGSMGLYHVDHMKFWHGASLSTLDMRVAKAFKIAGHGGSVAVTARDIGGSYFDYHDEMVINPRLYLSFEVGL